MNPTSPLVEVLILGFAVGLLVVVVRIRLLVAQIAAGAMAIVLAMTAGIVGVNDYFGYYQSWTDAYTDLSGHSLNTGYTGADPDTVATAARFTDPAHGTVEQISLPGKHSGITRSGYVYLPPQYWQPKFRHTRFPVVELLHGTPGKPADWIVSMHINQLADQLIGQHQIGPMIMVAPTIAPRGTAQECLNAARAPDETYIDTDVPDDLSTRFRVASDPAQWGLFGLSAGGYCAANLGLRHPAQWGAVVSLDGYYLPSDGDAKSIINHNPTLAVGNNPVQTAALLPPGTAPLPAFYLSAGTGNSDDMTEERLFADALAHLERVHVTVLRGGQHTFYSLRQVAPAALEWTWNQLSTPDLKTWFPITGATSTAVQQQVPQHMRHRTARPSTNAAGARPRTATPATAPTRS